MSLFKHRNPKYASAPSDLISDANNVEQKFTEVLKSIRTPPIFFRGLSFFISPGDLVCARNSWGNKKRQVSQKNGGVRIDLRTTVTRFEPSNAKVGNKDNFTGE